MASKADSDRTERVVTSTCSYDCGARCLLKVHVSEGRVERILTENQAGLSLKACGRGLAQGRVVHAPDRLTEPLKRVGERGSGAFEPISWDEALGAVCGELSRVKEQHGSHSIFLMDSRGAIGALHDAGKAARRFFALFGRCTTPRGNTSLEAAIFASRATFGSAITGATRDTLLHSRLILFWGWNPEVTRFGPDTACYLEEVRKRGARVLCVDPRQTPSAKALADEWIPIRPGTDAALLIAMAHVMIAEDLYDHRFVDAYTSGFEAFRDYVTGKEDGEPKTPGWAERITGVPAPTAERLAREYAGAKPAALCAGWAPGRSAFGEQFHRAAQVLAAMTGNIGVKGGYVGGGTGIMPLGNLAQSFPVPKGENPSVHVTELYDALLRGKAGGYPSDIKLLYVVASNFLNQFLNVNKGVQALKAPEFIVAHELFLTPTARHADIILPVTHFLEREDVGQPWAGGPYFIHMGKALDPLPGTRSDLSVFSELASRLGLADYNPKSDEEWLRAFVAATPGLPAYETLREQGVHRVELDGPYVAFREQIENPARNPFRTPSGKIEIYSQILADMKNPLIPPIPTYIPPWEGPGDPLAETYPLQLVSPHSKGRINSQGDNVQRMKALADDILWLNPADAEPRGIATGDSVRVYNGRGQLLATVKVTERILKGVASLDQGAWYRPDAQGLDHGGCVNVLTRDQKSPGGAFTGSTCLVQIEKKPLK